jgi:hypothetical protein
MKITKVKYIADENLRYKKLLRAVFDVKYKYGIHGVLSAIFDKYLGTDHKWHKETFKNDL